MHTRLTPGVAVLLVVGLTSCGRSEPPQQATASPPPAAAPAAPSPDAAASPAVPARDVSTLKACEIVTPQEAATIAGGQLLNEPPAGFANCAYVVEVGGNTESYRLLLTEPGLYTAMLDAQSPAEKGERIDGLWDEAYVQPRTTGGISVIVLRRGDLALEVSGDRRDPALEIARLAASRLN